jgi:hypothetical protein
MIIVNRIVELIVKYRSSDLTKKERRELREWLDQGNGHYQLFCELNDDKYLYDECAKMLEGDKAASWKQIEQKIFNTLSDAPPFEEMPEVGLPEIPGSSPPALKQKV